MVAERYGQLLDAIPNAGTRKTFVPCLIKLLQDEEAEVRTAAAFQVASTCKSNPDLAVVASVLDCVRQLVEDPNQHVRAALASVVLDLAPSLGRERTIKDLLPHFLLLLRDDFHEVAAAYCIVWRPLFPSQSHLLQVRMNIICKLDLINRVIGIDLLSETLLPAIFELSQDKVCSTSMRTAARVNSRIDFCHSVVARQGVHHRAHAAVRAAARPLVFSRATICSLRFVADRLRFRGAPSCCCQPQRSVQGVGASMESQPSPSKAASCSEARKVRCRFTCRLKIHQFPFCTVLSLEWFPTPNSVLPYPRHSYLSRNVALDGIGKLAVSIGSEAAVISLAALQKGASDAVPNVRFNAIKALRFVAPLLPPQDVTSIVLPIMRNLATADSDVDVCLLCASHVALFMTESPLCIPGPIFRRRCPCSVVLS
jgi:hypothetical protein